MNIKGIILIDINSFNQINFIVYYFNEFFTIKHAHLNYIIKLYQTYTEIDHFKNSSEKHCF